MQIKEEFEYIKETIGFFIYESTDDVIKFNGIGDDEHEDFYLNKYSKKNEIKFKTGKI